MSAVAKSRKKSTPRKKPFTDCAVADLSLAPWGRREIGIAEVEMPGLMAVREENAEKKPLRGARIAGSIYDMHFENATTFVSEYGGMAYLP